MTAPHEPVDARDLMAQYLAGELSAERQRDFEQEILANDDLSRELYDQVLLRSLLERPARRPASRPILRLVFGRSWKRNLMVLGPIAALVVAVFFVPNLRQGTTPRPVLRGERDQPAAIEPIGAVSGAPSMFRWSRVFAADRYRFRIAGLDGSVIYETVVADTFLALPSSTVELLPQSGVWRVTPLRNGIDGESMPWTPFQWEQSAVQEPE